MNHPVVVTVDPFSLCVFSPPPFVILSYFHVPSPHHSSILLFVLPNPVAGLVPIYLFKMVLVACKCLNINITATDTEGKAFPEQTTAAVAVQGASRHNLKESVQSFLKEVSRDLPGLY